MPLVRPLREAEQPRSGTWDAPRPDSFRTAADRPAGQGCRRHRDSGATLTARAGRWQIDHMTTLRSSIVVMVIMTTGPAMAGDVPASPPAAWADVMALPAVRAVVEVLAPAERATVNEATADWVRTPLMIRDDGTRYATACRPHLCQEEYVRVELGPDGRARIFIAHGR